jgi:hypothetical protein
MKQIQFFLIILILLTGCNKPQYTGNVISIDKDTLPINAANLPMMNMTSVDSFDRYKTFADNTNDLITILNNKNELFKIPKFEVTQEAWGRLSKKITEYSPLINNYNQVVGDAKIYVENNSKENLDRFYISSGKFAFESAIIVGALFYTASFEIVGFAYRSVGMNALALKCGPCVSVILSNAHWFIRTFLVESASNVAENVMNYTQNLLTNSTIK